MDEAEGYDSDEFNSIEVKSLETDKTIANPNEMIPKISWLLQVSLENLGVVINPLKVKVKQYFNQRIMLNILILQLRSANITTSTALCIESLHVISTMARHFTLVKDHLPLIMSAFQQILLSNRTPAIAGDSSSSDIRLHAIRCIDMLGHHLNVHMSADGSTVPEDLNAGFAFWETIVVVLIENLQSNDASLAVRATSCEALSNIGVYTYERLPVSVFLSIFLN